MLAPDARGIRVALVGIGNCASSLVQGLSHYGPGDNEAIGLMHYELGGYRPADIRVVAAWDIDRRKVGEVWNKVNHMRANPKNRDALAGIDLTLFALLTGCRRDEGATLTWDRVNIDEHDPSN